MSCPQQVGVRNLLITFTDCDTGAVIGPISHKLASDDELPTINSCGFTNTPLSNGRIRRTTSNATMKLNVIPQDTMPLAYYQGCAAVDVQLEYFSGRVFTGNGGSVTESDGSNLEGVAMNIVFKTIDDNLPEAQVA